MSRTGSGAGNVQRVLSVTRSLTIVATVAIAASCAIRPTVNGSAASLSPITPAPSSTAAPPIDCPVDATWPSERGSPTSGGPLFVSGSPSTAKLCKYSNPGSDGPPPVGWPISGAALTYLVSALNALVPTKDTPPCGAPEWSDVMWFDDPSGPPSMVVAVIRGGCGFVWNGKGEHAYASVKLSAELAAMDGRMPSPPSSNSPAPMSSATALATPPTPSRASVSVTPATGLSDGETVHVAIAGFRAGAKVWLSECANRADVNDYGCGQQLAAQPFLVTDDSGAGTGSFTVSATAFVRADDISGAVACEHCVLVAASGVDPSLPALPTASAPLSFAMTAPAPSH
jgi:hypothetical protein